MVIINENNLIRYNTPTAIVLFLLSPLLSLPYLLVGVYNRKKGSFPLFSLFWGVMAWLQIPYADLYRHTITAYGYVGKSLATVLAQNFSFDNGIPLVTWFIVNNGLPYQILRFVTLSLCLYLLLKIFNDLIDNSTREYTQGEAFTRFLILFFFFEFIRTTSGVRYGFALYLYVYALYSLFAKRQYLKFLLITFIVIEIHMSFSLIIPLSLVTYAITTKRKNLFLFLVAISFFIIPFLSSSLGQEMLGRRADWYFSGGKSMDDNMNITIYGFILFVLIRAFLIPFIVLAFKFFSKELFWSRLLIVFTGIVILFLSNTTLLLRITFFISAIGVFSLIEIEEHFRLKEKFINLILLCALSTTLFNTVNFRTIIANSRYQYSIMPVPVILTNQYQKQWIIEHVDNNKMKVVHE